MRIRTMLGSTALILGLSAIAVSPASAAPRFRHDGGHALAVQLETTTDRLQEAADARRLRGRTGREIASRLHRMDQWASYYRSSVEQDGFRSRQARQRFDRFLVEYRAASEFLDDARRPFARMEIARLHRTVAQLSGIYGVHVAGSGRWDDRQDRRGRRH